MIKLLSLSGDNLVIFMGSENVAWKYFSSQLKSASVKKQKEEDDGTIT